MKLHEQPNDKSKGFIKVRTLKDGDHFGELALINKQARSLSVKVCSESGCNLLVLDAEGFIRILGSIEQFLKKDYDKKFDNQYKILKDESKPELEKSFEFENIKVKKTS